MAGATGVHELVRRAVLLRVEEVGALAAETEMNLIRLLCAAGGRGGRARRHGWMDGGSDK